MSAIVFQVSGGLQGGVFVPPNSSLPYPGSVDPMTMAPVICPSTLFLLLILTFQVLPFVGPPININPGEALHESFAQLDAFSPDQMSATSTPVCPSNLSGAPPNNSLRHTRSAARYVSSSLFCSILISSL